MRIYLKEKRKTKFKQLPVFRRKRMFNNIDDNKLKNKFIILKTFEERSRISWSISSSTKWAKKNKLNASSVKTHPEIVFIIISINSALDSHWECWKYRFFVWTFSLRRFIFKNYSINIKYYNRCWSLTFIEDIHIIGMECTTLLIYLISFS